MTGVLVLICPTTYMFLFIIEPSLSDKYILKQIICSFRLIVNLLRPATVAVKIEKIPIICSNVALCNSCCDLQLVWTRLKHTFLKTYWSSGSRSVRKIGCGAWTDAAKRARITSGATRSTAQTTAPRHRMLEVKVLNRALFKKLGQFRPLLSFLPIQLTMNLCLFFKCDSSGFFLSFLYS